MSIQTAEYQLIVVFETRLVEHVVNKLPNADSGALLGTRACQFPCTQIARCPWMNVLLTCNITQKALSETMIAEVDKNNHWLCKRASNTTELKVIHPGDASKITKMNRATLKAYFQTAPYICSPRIISL